VVDLIFPVHGEALPADHAYPLYAALSRVVPAFHDPAARVRFAPVGGPRFDRGTLRITAGSRLRVRLPQERIGDVLPLAGKRLEVDGHAIRLGVPFVTALEPAPALHARAVVIKCSARGDKGKNLRYTEVGPFLDAVREQSEALGVGGEWSVPVKASGPRAGEPVRRVVRVKGRAMVGFGVLVEGLTADGSIRLQEHGLGGRTRLGCGFFLPVRARG
jgi:CRISPR-associated protein Cas6